MWFLRGEAAVKRRDFLMTVGAAALLPSGLSERQAPSSATVLYDGRAVNVMPGSPIPGDDAESLWIDKVDLPRINEFELKPEGACRADVCIPVPSAMLRGDQFHLTAFARRAGQSFVADPGARVWSLGEMPVVRGSFLESRLAPEVAVPDRTGRLVRLSQFRGKKVLLVTWASW
jgi:hypothetical protein